MTVASHTLFWGQSLSVGSQGKPSLSTVSEVPNAFLVAADGTASVPLKSSVQQQPQLSCGYRLAEARPGMDHVFSTHGLGGRTLEQLSKGGSSGKYEEAISYVTAAHSVQAGHVVEAVHAIQGEADQLYGTSISAYVDGFAALHADFTADIGAVTGQGTVPLITSQTATWAYYDSPARIGLAHLEAARTLPGVYIIGGQYHLPYVDDLHLTNVGYYKLGELHARAHQAVVDTGGWPVFAPVAYTVEPTHVDVTYEVPSGPLRFDTTTVAAQPSMGFSLAGTAAQITDVTITGADTVRLGLSQPITEPGAHVGYGVSARNQAVGLGNLCDSDPSLSVLDDEPLQNWALHSLDPLPIPEPDPAFFYRTRRSFYMIGEHLHEVATTREVR